MTGDQSAIKSRMATGQGNLFQPTYPQLRITVKLCGAVFFFYCFLFCLFFPEKYRLHLTGVDISSIRKTKQTNKKPHQNKASKSTSKKKKKKKEIVKALSETFTSHLTIRRPFFFSRWFPLQLSHLDS